ncbi:MAG: hypothetical protein HQ464_00115, partial [Planctomycetes bacterium]|nr:hypothetical protein [Planctomycetota bacterium]
KSGEGKSGEAKSGEGKSGEGKSGEGKSGGQEPGGGQADGKDGNPEPQAAGNPQQQGSTADKPSGQPATGEQGSESKQSSPVGGGGVSNGAEAAQRSGKAPEGPPSSKETEWQAQELNNARNAADLAVEHLRKSMESGNDQVLDDLGWSRDQARSFLDRWELMRQQAQSTDPRQRAEFERALRSLGMRPAGVQSSREVPADAKGGQAEGRRSRPPSDYRERFKAFLQGTSGE